MPFTPVDITWNIISAIIVLVLPGAVWVVWLPGSRADPFERLADAIGVSVSLTAFGGLVGFLAGISWVNETFLNYAAIGLLVLFVVGLLVRVPWKRSTSSRGWLSLVGGLLGVAALLGLIFFRFYQARSLVLPAWVDPVHHTLIVKIILAVGGVPASLDPQIPAFFSYHYGFHLIAAIFAAWSRTQPADAILWFGQIINALVALSIYRLGKTVWQDARLAALAALLVGFAFHMPAYYLTWGRYTLLTGLLLLPLAMAAALQITRQPAHRADWLRLVLLTAGVALSHYTALLLLGFFMIVLLAGRGLTKFIERRLARKEPTEVVKGESPPPLPAERPFLDGLWQPASAALLGLLLAAPWLLRVWQQSGSQAGVSLISPFDGSQLDYGKYLLYLLTPLNNEVLLGLAGVGLILAFVLRSARWLAAWGLLLALLTLPWGLRLGPFRPDHMAIILFVPASLLIGDLAHNLGGLLARLHLAWLRQGLQGIMILTVLGLVGWGVWSSRDVINPTTVFVTPADVEALQWVERSTPEDARFLINTTLWMASIYRGVDGGYWLMPYAGRQSLLPPVLYTNGTADYVAKINDWAERMSKLTTCDDAFWSLVGEANPTYIYLREGQGSLQPDGLANCPNLVPVYRRNGVYIYEINK